LLAGHDNRTNDDSCPKLDFEELPCDEKFSFRKNFVLWKKNKQINVTVLTGIATSLRTIENSLCLGQKGPNLLPDLIYYLCSFHIFTVGCTKPIDKASCDSFT